MITESFDQKQYGMNIGEELKFAKKQRWAKLCMAILAEK